MRPATASWTRTHGSPMSNSRAPCRETAVAGPCLNWSIPGRSGPNWSSLPVAEGAHVVPTTIGPVLTFAESGGVRTCPRNTPVARLPARSC